MADESSCKYSDRAKNTETCSHLSVVERYYVPKYKIGFGTNKDEDHCVLTHSNKICLVTVAPSHPLIREKKVVNTVNFQVDKNTNRLSNKVAGKSKKGAYSVTPSSALCHVTCADGAVFTLYACMRGQLVEVNSNLVENPQLLTEKPQTEGYIGIILSKLKDYETEMGRLLTQDQYHQKLSERTSTVS